MIQGLIGTKIGMTEIFLEDGTALPATVVNAGPCFVVDKRSKEKNGYDAIQLGYVDLKPQRVTKPLLGHFKRAGVPPLRTLYEFEGEIDKYKPGDVVEADVFKDGDIIDVTGTSKGKGFAGVMKRHGFSGQPDSHGGMSHRRPGSIGQAAYPARVWKGMKMPGHMGSKRVTVQGLEVAKVETEKNMIIIKGSVPGPNGGVLILKHTTKGI
ncbi:50S ribosomal protein L3 [Desulfobacterota bacterium AH_259_B03_O07]|nr:50S ribosomal protein L3 [Desulfobacterota bacterium AH_259_B03_O07]